MTGTTETITRDELAEALARLKITPEDENTFYPAVAGAIFEQVLAQREPEYEPGAVYECARGDVWQFTRGAWETPGVSGPVPFGVPERPLCKLVREGSQAARLSYADVLAAIGMGMEHEEDYTQLAARVCKLLEAAE